ncbi:MAG: diguanylate cyclase [Solirubrobacterales bacterium]|nr:diguanylate cyclase [Solirubrobacterales bacterium]
MPGTGTDLRDAPRIASGPVSDGLIARIDQLYAHLQSLVENFPGPLSLRDLEGRYQLMNSFAYQQVQHLLVRKLERQEILGRTPEEIYGPELGAKVTALDKRASESKQPVASEIELPDAEGNPHHFEMSNYPVIDAAGRVTGHGRVGLEVTEVRKAWEQREAAETLAQAAFEHAPTGIALLRIEGQRIGGIERVNPALCTMLGYSAEQLQRISPAELIHPDNLGSSLNLARLLYRREIEKSREDTRLIRSDGQVLWVSAHARLLCRHDQPTHLVLQVIDISDRRALEERLRHQADHDPLTGLLNRRAFEQLLDDRIARAASLESPAALLVLDIDHLKLVNDTLGHSAGDELIIAVARRLEASVRAADTVARLAGDEFAVLLPDVGIDTARYVAEGLVQAISADDVILCGDSPKRVTASVGVAQLGPDLTSGKEALINADLAMYGAKRGGRGRAAVDPGAQLTGAG